MTPELQPRKHTHKKGDNWDSDNQDWSKCKLFPNSLERVGILKGNKHLEPRISKITSNSRCSAVITTSGSPHSGRTGALRTGHFQQNWQECTQTSTCPKNMCFDNTHSASFSILLFLFACVFSSLLGLKPEQSEKHYGTRIMWKKKMYKLYISAYISMLFLYVLLTAYFHFFITDWRYSGCF